MPDDRRVLDGVARLIVDGTNVLHALARSPQPLPSAALIGRLRAIVPPGVAVLVVLDGSPEHGMVTRHVASGVEVRYAGREPADALIARLAADPSAERTAATLVVTDDAELGTFVRRSGGRTARNDWLLRRLARQRLSAPSPARPSAQVPPATAIGRPGGTGRGASTDGGDGAEAEDRPRWAPGRGATRKRGNGRRPPSTGRPRG